MSSLTFGFTQSKRETVHLLGIFMLENGLLMDSETTLSTPHSRGHTFKERADDVFQIMQVSNKINW